MNIFQVRTAVQFLVNPKVKDSSVEHKTTFLKKKGLTDLEISFAIQRALTAPSEPPVPVISLHHIYSCSTLKFVKITKTVFLYSRTQWLFHLNICMGHLKLLCSSHSGRVG